jgi:hypothetical protein
MQTENTRSTINTKSFDNFNWKRLPLEHDYVTIIFCLDNFKITDNSSDILSFIENENTKKAIKYILNIMPHECIINIDDYLNYQHYKDNKDNKDNILLKLDKLNVKYNILNDDNIKFLEEKIKSINDKKTYIFTYNDNMNKYLNITLDSKFNETHRLCIGEIDNIPKYNLSVADYIFFENKDILNKYLESQKHNLRITSSNAPFYLLDKCNYQYYHLFNFNKHIN